MIHPVGLVAIFRWLRVRLAPGTRDFWPSASRVLMCGRSTGMFFVVFSDIFGLRTPTASET